MLFFLFSTVPSVPFMITTLRYFIIHVLLFRYSIFLLFWCFRFWFIYLKYYLLRSLPWVLLVLFLDSQNVFSCFLFYATFDFTNFLLLLNVFCYSFRHILIVFLLLFLITFNFCILFFFLWTIFKYFFLVLFVFINLFLLFVFSFCFLYPFPFFWLPLFSLFLTIC